MNKYIPAIVFILAALSACDNSGQAPKNAKALNITERCKPLENKCELLAQGLNLQLQFKVAPSYQRLLPITLESKEKGLEKATIVLIIGDKEMPPILMEKAADNKHWSAQLMPFAAVSKDNLKLRLTISSQSEIFYAEFPVHY